MAHMSVIEKSYCRDFGDSCKLTNWILDSGETYHMTPQVSGFIPGSLEDTDKDMKLRMDMTSQRIRKYKSK